MENILMTNQWYQFCHSLVLKETSKFICHKVCIEGWCIAMSNDIQAWSIWCCLEDGLVREAASIAIARIVWGKLGNLLGQPPPWHGFNFLALFSHKAQIFAIIITIVLELGTWCRMWRPDGDVDNVLKLGTWDHISHHGMPACKRRTEGQTSGKQKFQKTNPIFSSEYV